MKQQLIIIWSATVVIAAAIGYFAIWPGIEHDLAVLNQTKAAQKDLENSAQKKMVLAKLNKDKELPQLVAQVKQSVPEDAQAGELILMLTDLAQRANLTVDQATFDQKAGNNPVPIGGAIATGFQLKLSGSFADAMTFLNLAQSAKRMVILQNIKLYQSGGSFRMDINGTAYSKQGFENNPTLENITIKSQSITTIKNLANPGLNNPVIRDPFVR